MVGSHLQQVDYDVAWIRKVRAKGGGGNFDRSKHTKTQSDASSKTMPGNTQNLSKGKENNEQTSQDHACGKLQKMKNILYPLNSRPGKGRRNNKRRHQREQSCHPSHQRTQSCGQRRM